MLVKDKRFTVIESLCLIAPASAFWLLLGAIYFEGHDIMATRKYITISEHPVSFICAGLLGFMVNIVGYFVIQSSGAVMLKVK